MAKTIFKVFIVILAFSFAVYPLMPVAAQYQSGGYYGASSGSYTYRSTVLGCDLKQPKKDIYEVANTKTNYDTGEPIIALTRIFNISRVRSFTFRRQLYNGGNLYRETYSPNFQPNGKWWSENYSYDKLGPLPAGDYQLKMAMSLDGGDWRNLDTKNFSVRDNVNYNYRAANYNTSYNNSGQYNRNYYNTVNRYYGNGTNNYNNYSNYDLASNYYYSSNNYTYDWTKTGTNVRFSGYDDYEVVNDRVDFKTNETVYALTKISNLRGVNTFKIKQDLYLNGNRYYATQESNQESPNGSNWSKYYYWGVFSNLAKGFHEIRAYISINGGSYMLLDTKQISVGETNIYRGGYYYNGTDTDNRLIHVSGYIYSLDNPKANFNTNESVIVLTKLTNIRGIRNFRVKHELYDGNNHLVKSLETPNRNPNYANWEYNYNYNDFGALSAGSYVIKVYLSINDGSYNYLDTKYITVTDAYNTVSSYNYFANPNYTYDWTQTGTNNGYNNQNYYQYYSQPVNY